MRDDQTGVCWLGRDYAPPLLLNAMRHSSIIPAPHSAVPGGCVLRDSTGLSRVFQDQERYADD